MFPKDVPHNSIWDFIRTPGGRFFVSLCAEGSISSSGRLYEYLPAERRLRFCFDLLGECMVGSRAIPPSKIHSSMCVMPDGRLIMATHNTAPAPGHPFWMFDAYYSHMWEGFSGSHLLIYDPAANEVRNLGIPIHRESIYGGVYDERHHAYYAIGYARGHMYRIDLHSREIADFGQVAEFGAFRLTVGPDGHIYGATRTGWLYKVDVDRREIVSLNQQLPSRPDYPARTQYAFGATGPDGRLYMSNHVSDLLAALDVTTGKLEVLGSADPGPINRKNYPRCPSGLVFDGSGALWFTVHGAAEGYMGLWSHLVRWDITHGGRPELAGLLGTPDRTVWYSSEMIHHDNVLYATDTNHLEDPPGILRIDLAELAQARGEPRERSRDPMAYGILADAEQAYPGKPEDLGPFRAMERSDKAGGEFFAQNTYTIQAGEILVFRVWRQLPVDESSVRKLQWLDNSNLRAVCGTGKLRVVICSVDGSLTVLDTPEAGCLIDKIPAPSGLAELSNSAGKIRLPHRQGRQYLATAASCAPWRHGQWLIGTRDGMLARVDLEQGKAFSVGAVCTNGPVHQIVTNAARTLAFGVAGDEADLGSCFRYDDENGIWELGRTYTFEGTRSGLSNSCQPCCVALSPDESRLAIGAADRLGAVYVYRNLCPR